VTIVREKEDLIEPNTGDDKHASACQSLAGQFEVTGLDNSLKEQLNGFASISIEVMFPRCAVAGNCWGVSSQPPCWRHRPHQVRLPKSNLPAQFRTGSRWASNADARIVLSPTDWGTSGKERHRDRKDQPLQDQPIALAPSRGSHSWTTAGAVSTLRRVGGMRRFRGRGHAHVALRLIHSPIDGRGLRGIRAALPPRQDLLPQRLHLNFPFRQCGLQARSIVRRCGTRTNPRTCRRLGSLPTACALLGLEGAQHHRHHRQEQKARSEKVRGRPRWCLGGWVHIGIFDLPQYSEQCVGGQRDWLASTRTVQGVSTLCYPRRIYAQASC